jgi:hypothetical protein
MVLLIAPGVAGSQEREAPSRYDQLTAMLEAAPAALVLDFARSALQEMALAYAEEAQLARTDRRALARNRGLPRWSRTVDSYARHLEGLVAGLGEGARVALSRGPDGQPTLFLDSGPVVVSGPRISQPQVLEQRILGRFCALHPCDMLFAMQRPVSERPEPPRRRPPPVSVSWLFRSGAGPVCRGDGGLELWFDDNRELVRKRRLCSQLAGELSELATALADQRRRGAEIHWDALRVTPSAGGVADRVAFNRGGDVLRLSLPLLAADAALLEQAGPWLAAWADGEPGALVLRDAERLLGTETVPVR